jgi:hypothetical protein
MSVPVAPRSPRDERLLPDGAAQESNLPSLGLPDLNGFEQLPSAQLAGGFAREVIHGCGPCRSRTQSGINTTL